MEARPDADLSVSREAEEVWHGLGVSTGMAEGPARLILSPSDLTRTLQGEVLVVRALDPGMAPVFGLAAAVVAELGGILSHGAIIAREYGIPAVVNIPEIPRRLSNGDWIVVDAHRGEIRRRPRGGPGGSDGS